jgi:transcription elongation factor Elf1
MNKTCGKCQELKPLTEFNIRGRKHQAYCKICNSDYKKDNYQQNKAAVIKKNADRRRSLKVKTWEYLKDKSCLDCGENDIVVLDFDHRDPKMKSFTVNKMLMNTMSWDNIFKEIQKCDIRCANCHRRRTAKQFNWLKQILQD